MKKLFLISVILLLGVGSSYAYSGCIFSASCPYGEIGFYQETTVLMPSTCSLYAQAYVEKQGSIKVETNNGGWHEILHLWSNSSFSGDIYECYPNDYIDFKLTMDNAYLGPGVPGGTVYCLLLY